MDGHVSSGQDLFYGAFNFFGEFVRGLQGHASIESDMEIHKVVWSRMPYSHCVAIADVFHPLDACLYLFGHSFRGRIEEGLDGAGAQFHTYPDHDCCD